MPKTSKVEKLKEKELDIEENEIENEEELFAALLNWENDEELSEIEKEIEAEEYCNDANDLNNVKKWVLTRVQEKIIFEALRNSDNEEEKLVLKQYLVYKNIKLVYTLVKKKFWWFDIDDIFNQWIEWLYDAIEKFDIDKGFKFSTYAIWWIKKKIQDFSIDFKYQFRITWHKLNEITQLKRLQEEHQIKYWQYPSEEELYEMSWLAKKTFDSAYQLLNGSFTSLDSSPYWENSDWASYHNLLVWEDLEKTLEEREMINLIKQASCLCLKPIEKRVFDLLNWFEVLDWRLVDEEMDPDLVADALWIERALVRKYNRVAQRKIAYEVRRLTWQLEDEFFEEEDDDEEDEERDDNETFEK